MNERARLRVLRNFLASILMSNLRKSDIAEIADDLAYGRLGKDLGDALRDMLMLLPDLPASNEFAHGIVEAVSPEAKIAYDMAQRKKITKKSLIQVMSSISPRLLKDDIPTGTIRELLEWFFDVASPQQRSKLLSLLSDAEQDQYLKGITRR